MTEKKLAQKCESMCLPYHTLPHEWQTELLRLINDAKTHPSLLDQKLADAQQACTYSPLENHLTPIRQRLSDACLETSREIEAFLKNLSPKNAVLSFSGTQKPWTVAESQMYYRLTEQILSLQREVQAMLQTLFSLSLNETLSERTEIDRSSHLEILRMAILLLPTEKYDTPAMLQSLKDISDNFSRVAQKSKADLSALIECCENTLPGRIDAFFQNAETNKTDALRILAKQFSALSSASFLINGLDFSLKMS